MHPEVCVHANVHIYVAIYDEYISSYTIEWRYQCILLNNDIVIFYSQRVLQLV